MGRYAALLVAVAVSSNFAADPPVWWSLKPLQRPAVPKGADSHPVDAFIRQELSNRGLRPSPEADRRTLIRRLTVDLHGLPPTPDEIAEFSEDRRVDAVERLIDRLLASPRYGERWGRHWLDIVPYADTHGYDKDKRRDHSWPYRDYVINALNRDIPYEQFIREQIAGDVIAPTNRQAVTASGFVTAGPWDFVGHVELREGTVEKDKTRVLDRDDMVTNTSAAFLSLTVHCARCHDHKFDPITQVDYYRLQAVFAGIDRGNRPIPPDEQHIAQTESVKRRVAEIDRQITAAETEDVRRIRSEVTAIQARIAKLPAPPAGKAGSPTNGYHSSIMPTADHEKWVQVDLGRPTEIDMIRLFPARPTDFPDTPGFGFPLRYRVEISDDADFKARKPIVDRSAADQAGPGDQPVTIDANGVRARYVRITAVRLWKRTNDYVFALAEMQVESQNKVVSAGAAVTAKDSIDSGRWHTRHLVDGRTSRNVIADPQTDRQAAKRVEADRALARAESRLAAERIRVIPKRLLDEFAQVRIELSNLEKTSRSSAYGPVPLPAPRAIHVLKRGDVKSKQQEVSAGPLQCVNGPDVRLFADPNLKEGRRREALARWIAAAENPLTWRSVANRVWHYHFDRGLVDTPNDFGKNGSQPTHPELLDYLADEIRTHQSLKQLHRLIVTSATYRQSSAHRADESAKDADNRFLWRGVRRRLDAEAIRDSVLASAGTLRSTMGGPGYELFRFKDDHSPVYDHTDADAANRPETWRRTVYRFVVRSVPNPFLDSLDCADPNVSTPRRNQTQTAVQSLAMLNDEFFIRQSKLMVERRLPPGGSDLERVDGIMQWTIGRSATAEERRILSRFAADHGWANTCRLVWNLNEFVFID